jgi:hypothetical protein
MTLMLVGGAVLGTYVLITADDAVEVVLGSGILLGPAVIVGFYVWLYLKAFQTLRADRK